MRIALITPGFSAHENDWAIPALQNLATALAQAHDLHVFSLRYPSMPPAQFGGFAHHAMMGGKRFKLGSLAVWLRAVRAIAAEHRRQPFDILHAFWADEPGLVAALAGRLLRRPTVVSSAGGEFVFLPDIQYGTGGSRFRRAVVRFAAGRAGLVTGGSGYQLDLGHRFGIPARRLRQTPLGVDTQRFVLPDEPPPSAPFTMIQAASLTPVKNQHMLLLLFRDVQEQLREARLLIVGDGPLHYHLQLQAEQLGISAGVRWLDRVPYPRMAAVLGSANVYVQTSRHESQGMAVLEAMACGLPAVGTPVGILPEVAAAPPSWEPAVIAQQIVAFAQEGERDRERSIQVRQIITDSFSLQRSLEQFQDHYAALLT